MKVYHEYIYIYSIFQMLNISFINILYFLFPGSQQRAYLLCAQSSKRSSSNNNRFCSERKTCKEGLLHDYHFDCELCRLLGSDSTYQVRSILILSSLYPTYYWFDSTLNSSQFFWDFLRLFCIHA